MFERGRRGRYAARINCRRVCRCSPILFNNGNIGILLEPIGKTEQRLVVAETDRYVRLAGEIFNRQFARVPVMFDLSGRTAGMFKLVGRRGWIRYNPWIFAKYFEENLNDTVPHEVAHFVVHQLYGTRGVKPHGRQWRAVMERFGADQGVTFTLDLEGIPQRQQRTHPYRCGCRVHDVSSTRHNRVVQGVGRYHCRICGDELSYAG